MTGQELDRLELSLRVAVPTVSVIKRTRTRTQLQLTCPYGCCQLDTSNLREAATFMARKTRLEFGP